MPARTPSLAAALAATLMLAACSGATDQPGTQASATPSDKTLAAMVADDSQLSTVSATLQDAGLAQAFDGVASYTLLAPRDSAFEALGDAGKALRTPEQRAALVAVLRDHIVSGYLTPDDIARAIANSSDGKVAVKTMAGHTLTFAKSGDAITATGTDGASVHLAGDALLAGNGVAIPVDGLAVKLADAETARQ